MPEERKLKMLKYNKTLQSYLNIGIINYMHFKNKYIVYDTKGIGKEYDYYSGKLIYEGEYLHGERNGKGKEFFYNGKIKFEGEYLNGKRNGKGKEYYENGVIKYIGGYLKGERNGKGKEQTDNGKPRFEGEYLNGKEITGIKYAYNGNPNKQSKQVNGIGKEYEYNTGILEYEGGYLNYERNGKGREYCLDFKLRFEGEYLNGKKWSGKGYYYTISGGYSEIYELKDGKGYIKEYNFDRNLIYEGEYLNGERNGKGKEYNPGEKEPRFEGEYLNGKKNGKGKEYYDYKDGKVRFEGEYFIGERNGKGKEYDYDGTLKYEGEYLNGQRNGKGKEFYIKNQLIFDGEYLYDAKIKGKYYVNNRLEYEGEFRYNKKWNGKGYDENGNVIYELINGNGKVKEYDIGRLKFDGEYLNGKRNGKGKEYNLSGKLIFEGEYLNGERKEY